MDVFQKLKAKLVEDAADSESDREAGVGAAAAGASSASSPRGRQAGDGASREEALEREVAELKEHINKNYFVYVRRLEKRKERIKELEEYAKLLIKDNETLQDKQKEHEECKQQLVQARGDLEQLEGFQNQELAKVKHMLLSAESALEQERQRRTELEEEAKTVQDNGDMQRQMAELQQKLESMEKDHAEAQRKAADAEKRLEEQLKLQDLGDDERLQTLLQERNTLDAKVQSLSAELSSSKSSSELELQSLRDRLSATESERDAARTQTIEAEIAGHERREEAEGQKEEARERLGQVEAKLQEAQAAIAARDEKMQKQEEEMAKLKASMKQAKEDHEKDSQATSSRLAAFEAEVSLLKKRLAEEAATASDASARAKKLEEDVSSRTDELRQSQAKLVEAKASVLRATGQAKEATERAEQLQAKLERSEAAVKESAGRASALENQLEVTMGRLVAAQEQERAAREEAERERATFAERVLQSDVVRELRSQIQVAEDELEDKRKMVKLHEKRMLDMKKTFQKELRSQAPETPAAATVNGGGPEGATAGNSRSPTPSSLGAVARLSPVPSSSSDASSPSPAAMLVTASPKEGLVTMSEVNFKYLKHVIFKFFTSPDPEAKHLTRAISALLRLTPDEERLLQQHLDWKTSWFGQKPKLGSGQFRLSIDPSN